MELKKGPETRVLFVCSMALLRSPTAAFTCHQAYGWHTKCAGTDVLAVPRVNEALLGWADAVVVMEKHHKDFLRKNFKNFSLDSVKVLNIKDNYNFMDPDLQALVLEKVRCNGETK